MKEYFSATITENIYVGVRRAEKKGEIDKLADEYIAQVKNLASEQRVEHLQKIQHAYSKCKEFSDDKVQLAMQTYEMVSFLAVFP